MSRPDLAPAAPTVTALRTCVCALAQAVAHQVEVLILMHPMEVHEAKGTGHLLHLCLAA
jgi:DTW domain-containing protein YfiP